MRPDVFISVCLAVGLPYVRSFCSPCISFKTSVGMPRNI